VAYLFYWNAPAFGVMLLSYIVIWFGVDRDVLRGVVVPDATTLLFT
jgi:hypothetical protein